MLFPVWPVPGYYACPYIKAGKLTNVAQFFAQKDGCLDQNCPFCHDREAVFAVRAQILETRRQRFTRGKHEATPRQQLARYHAVLDCVWQR
jgi:hypothetical protein